MTTEIKPFFIKTITPLHVGSGSDLGVVDMPIQRESHTGFPKIEASSLKGSIRSEFESKAQKNDEKKKIHIVFGCDDCEKDFSDTFTSKNRDFSGALGFTDSKILFFPIKSVKGVFAYVTCPMVLKRFKNDIEICKKEIKNGFDIPLDEVSKDSECIVLGGTCKMDKTKSVILEEYSFAIKETKTKDYIKIPNLDIEHERIVIISDDNFTHFVKNSTEVITRTKIDNITGTVQNGALFTEEYLPSETVMYSLAIANKPFSDKSDLTDANSVMEYFNNISKVIQIGGNSTLGKGIVEISCEGCKK
jgi:CRISPR-associated protein Cmr4